MTNKFYLIALFVLILSSILILIYPLLYQSIIRPSKYHLPGKHIKIVAHRGANKFAPENTLAAIKKALDIGVDMIEIDVHLTKDNQLIVIHDETLERTTNGSGRISGHTLLELKELDAGSWFSKDFIGEPLPTLDEVLEVINGQTTCLIEIKWEGDAPYMGIEHLVAKSIIANNAVAWTIVQSFKSSYLENLNATYPNIILGKLLIGSWSLPLPFYVDYKFHWGSYNPPNYIDWVNFYYKRATPAFIKQLQSKGVKVGLFTPNINSDILKEGYMNVDCIITNNLNIAK